MANLVKVAERSSLPPGQGRVVQAEGRSIALFNVGGRFFALDNTCRHRGGPLGEGVLQGATVACPWHGWQYDVTTGASAVDPAVSVASYPCKVEGDDVFVEV